MLSDFSSIFEIIVGFSLAIGIDSINKIIFSDIKAKLDDAAKVADDTKSICQLGIDECIIKLKTPTDDSSLIFKNATKLSELDSFRKKNIKNREEIDNAINIVIDKKYYENYFYLNGIIFFFVLFLSAFEEENKETIGIVFFMLILAYILHFLANFFYFSNQISKFEFAEMLLSKILISFLAIFIILILSSFIAFDFKDLDLFCNQLYGFYTKISLLIISCSFPYILLVYGIKSINNKIEKITEESIKKMSEFSETESSIII